MSNWSGLGFSGYDPIGSWIGNELEGHFMRKNSAHLASQNFQYALRAARELPTAQMEGLRAAGINPAVSYLKGLSAPAYSAPAPMVSTPMSGNSAASAVTGVGGIAGMVLGLREKKEDIESKKLENSAKAVEIQARINKAKLDSERDQFRRDRHFRGGSDDNSVRVFNDDVIKQIQDADSKQFENQIDSNLLKWIETLSNSASDLMNISKVMKVFKKGKGGISIKNTNINKR